MAFPNTKVNRPLWAGVGVLLLFAGIQEFRGAEESEAPRTPRQELALVRSVRKARDDYQASLERLRGYYVRNKVEESRYWVEQELTQYHMMVKDPYIIELDLPSRDLKPTQNIPEANKILRDALEQLNKTTLTESAKNHHRAEVLLRRLLNDYPQSDKIGDACYYLGDVYASRYFEQYRRSVAFYERVFLYNPSTHLNARLKAGIVYEKHLADRDRAKDLYQQVLAHNTEPTQTREAKRRLEKLLGSRSPNR